MNDKAHKKDKLLIVNPGSASTKIALYTRQGPLWQEEILHDRQTLNGLTSIEEQLPLRLQVVEAVLQDKALNRQELAGTVGRGGALPHARAGAYEVDQKILTALARYPVTPHASNLGAALAYAVAHPLGIPAYIYDPVTVDEMIDVVRITGLREIRRRGQGHNLNMRATALRYCRERQLDYRQTDLIVAHLGSGITLSLHSQGRIVDMITDSEGPFSPERAGALPTYPLLDIIRERPERLPALQKRLRQQGGLADLLGETDLRRVEERMAAGDREASTVYQAMALAVAKSIAALAVVVNGRIDSILLTGGMAKSAQFCRCVAQRVSFIAPVTVMPGENEMQALAQGGWRVIDGLEKTNPYD
ncbi:MAG: butyrate kinase [Firmicutes bacterium]|nr:butyrate kinase [Bacillota bacterium]